LVAGEPGVGKLELARCIHRQSGLSGDFTVFDAVLASTSGGAWLSAVADRLRQPGGSLVVRHVEALSASTGRSLASVIETAAAGGAPRLMATQTVNADGALDHAPVIDRFTVLKIVVPPLRVRREDIPDLVQKLLRRHSPGETPARYIAKPTMQLLVRFDWPGNVRQLENLLQGLLATGRGEVRIEELPSEIWRVTRPRLLTRMEQAEASQIEAALADADGNKVKAAQMLGISRSSLYRKLKALQIGVPALGS